MKNRSGDELDGCDKFPGRRSSILPHHIQGVADREIQRFMALISLIAGLLEAMSLLQSLFGQRFEEPSAVELSRLSETRQ